MLGQPADGLDVEMVGRLVEDQQVVTAEHQGDQGHPAALAAAERGDLTFQVDLGQQVLDDRPGRGICGPHVVGPAADDDVADGRGRGEIVGLMQVAHGDMTGVRDPARVRFEQAGQDLQQRGLAVTVATDDADHVTAAEPEADAVEQRAGAVGHRDAFGIDQVAHRRIQPLIALAGSACGLESAGAPRARSRPAP